MNGQSEQLTQLMEFFKLDGASGRSVVVPFTGGQTKPAAKAKPSLQLVEAEPQAVNFQRF
jgi:hypothetical protein